MGLCLPPGLVDAGVEVADADEALEPIIRPEHTRALDNVSASKIMPGTGCSLGQGDKWGNIVATAQSTDFLRFFFLILISRVLHSAGSNVRMVFVLRQVRIPEPRSHCATTGRAL